MPDSPIPRATRSESAAVAAGGAVGAAITYYVQTHADDTGQGAASLPLVTLLLVGAGCLAAGALLGGAGARLPRLPRALVIGLLCGITPVASYAAVGLTVHAGIGSAVFLVGTPVVALIAGVAGYSAASALTRRSGGPEAHAVDTDGAAS
ncbi:MULTISPECIES: hypothetical protein [Tsukamurella]|uniref:Uncharacterized protein n=1 Tax=Tsukamurella strandjordii TaxID=147577 RepID=A0AA90NDX8_9ACTN|nr:MULTISPECIES: hypothetical protein [Tsukamurella]MDP0400135.1 hypothetical protein [Tsukamurella strandjordii]GIZ97136.1 hypothetical protein TTY48_17480 [Tsukamurella sp. TY48]